MGKRKYEKVSNYWVYSIKIPSINKYYIGVSKLQCSQRWKKASYIGTVIEEYLEEWQDFEKTVLINGLTKEESYQYEDNIIRALQNNNLCLNKKRSGLITDDINAYNKEYRENNPEYREREKQRKKQWYEKNREKYNKYRKQWRLKKKLEKQQNQTSLPL